VNFFRYIIDRWLIFGLLVIALPIVAGVFAYQSLPKEGEPEISAPVAIVVTLYPGASPSEIESLVTNPIEEALSDLKDVDEMRSDSAEGVSVVVIDFQAEADLERSLQKVREKVTDARKDLPEEAEDPEVNEVSFSDIPIMIASVVGDIDPIKLRRLTEDVADEIELMPEVLAADVAGGLIREIQIFIDPERLSQYGLTLLDVYQAVQRSDINIPGGQVNVEGRRLLLRTLTEIKNVDDYNRVPLIRQGDRVVFLGDVAQVVDGHSEDITYSRVNGVSSVSIAIKKRTGANILETSRKVEQRLAELEKTFPAGVHATVTAEKAKFIKQGFDQMNNSAVFGLIIVVIVLYFAMGLRNAIITAFSIPLSLLLTFVFLKMFGMSNNDMVRFSLVLCIGMIVDNAIIVVENVYHHYQLGKDRIAAVIEGTAEIAMPVISATLTTMAAFLPMLLMTGVTGEYMGFLPKTVSIALSASLVVALVANPLILSMIMQRTLKKGHIVSPEEDLRQLKRIYVRGVTWALNHRFQVVVIIFLCLGGAFGLLATEMVKVEMFPYLHHRGDSAGHRGGDDRCRVPESRSRGGGARAREGPGGFHGGPAGPKRLRIFGRHGHPQQFCRDHRGTQGRQGVRPRLAPENPGAHPAIPADHSRGRHPFSRHPVGAAHRSTHSPENRGARAGRPAQDYGPGAGDHGRHERRRGHQGRFQRCGP